MKVIAWWIVDEEIFRIGVPKIHVWARSLGVSEAMKALIGWACTASPDDPRHEMHLSRI